MTRVTLREAEAFFDAQTTFLNLVRLDREFVEADHPRDKDGKFGSNGAPSSESQANESVTAYETGGISPQEEKIVKQYGQGNSYNINKYLRDPKAGKAELKKNFGNRSAEAIKSMETDVKAMDKIIAKSKLKKDVKLYRGVSDFGFVEDLLKNVPLGGEISFLTFSSTSKSDKWAKDFTKNKSGSGGGVIHINAPAGANALDMGDYSRFGHDEQEVVLGRNAKYVLDKYDHKNKTVYLTLKKD